MPRNFPFASSKIHKKSIESEFRNSKLENRSNFDLVSQALKAADENIAQVQIHMRLFGKPKSHATIQ